MTAPDELLVDLRERAGDTADLVIEDLVYTSDIGESVDVASLGKALAGLLPAEEEDTRARFEKNLVVLPDEDFAALVRRLPVRARIKLDEKKTTSGDDGNLWYEEQVPADCLFVSFVGARPGGEIGALNFHSLILYPLRVAKIFP